MSTFEYVMVLFSIIVGLAITTLIDGLVRTLRRDTDLRPGPIHTLWVVATLAYIILFWMGRWDVGGIVTEWTPGLVLTSLVLPILVYGWAALLFPPGGAHIDLDEYVIANRRPLFGVGILVLLAQIAGGYILLGPVGMYPDAPVTAMALAFVGVEAFLMWTPNRRVHLVGAVLGLLGSVVFFVRPLTIVQ